jgi:hypothetical protein
MTKYKTTNINTKGSMPIKVDCKSPPAAAAGAVWAKAEEINIKGIPDKKGITHCLRNAETVPARH